MRDSGTGRAMDGDALNLGDAAQVREWLRLLRGHWEPLSARVLCEMLSAFVRDLYPYGTQTDRPSDEAIMREAATEAAAVVMDFGKRMNEMHAGKGMTLQAQVWVLVFLLSMVRGSIEDGSGQTTKERREP